MTSILRHSGGSPSLSYFNHGGSGPILLLLHGVTRCAGDWESVLPTLMATWQVFSLDQRGHGRSEWADSYLVVDYVADVVNLIRHELNSPLTVFGHSLGAMVAAGVASQLPQLVQSAVLEDPPFHTMGDRISGSSWQQQFLGMRAAARQGGSIDEITNALAEIRLPSASGGFQRLGELRDRDSLQWSARCLSQLDPEVLTPVIEGRWLAGFDLAKILPSIKCPVLLLQADPSVGGALTDADAAFANSVMTLCQLIRVDGCGHQLHRDRPAEVLQAVQAFHSSIVPSTQ
jgi:pimeloyl-ACP methyl ester carboxylesterase